MKDYETKKDKIQTFSRSFLFWEQRKTESWIQQKHICTSCSGLLLCLSVPSLLTSVLSKETRFFFSCNRTVFPFLEKLKRTLVTHRFEMVAVTRFTNNDVVHKLQINLLLLQGPFMLTQDSKYGVCFEWAQPMASIPLVWPCWYEKKDYGPKFCWGTTALQVEIL